MPCSVAILLAVNIRWPNRDLLVITGIGQPGNGLFRDHQDMHGGLGVDVPERQAQIILVDDIGRNFPPDDFRKNCLCHGNDLS